VDVASAVVLALFASFLVKGSGTRCRCQAT
jgi:hypothetical protein